MTAEELQDDRLGLPGYAQAVPVATGGSSTVWRAREVAFDRLVAVKVLSQPVLDDDVRRRFERELSMTGRLSGHPHVVTVHASGFTRDGRPFVTSEWCPSGSLADVVARTGPLALQQVAAVGAAVASALAHAHAGGVVHRDVKPQNVLVTAYGAAALADFGIAFASAEATSATDSLTPLHAAPEVLQGSTASPAADAWGLGSTLWTALTGAAPFAPAPGEGVLPVMMRILSAPLPALPDGTDPGLADLLARLLAKDPSARPALDVVATDLAVLAVGAAPLPVPPPEPLGTRPTAEEVAGTGLAGTGSADGSSTVVRGRPSGLSELPEVREPAAGAPVPVGVLALASAGEVDGSQTVLRPARPAAPVAPPVPEPAPDSRRRRALVVWGSAAALLLVGGAAAVVASGGTPGAVAASGPAVSATPSAVGLVPVADAASPPARPQTALSAGVAPLPLLAGGGGSVVSSGSLGFGGGGASGAGTTGVTGLGSRPVGSGATGSGTSGSGGSGTSGSGTSGTSTSPSGSGPQAAAGSGSGSSGTSTGGASAAPVPPGAPGSLVVGSGDRQVGASWSPATAGSAPVTGYVATLSPGGATVTTGTNDRTATFSGLANGTSYAVSVVARSGSGTGPSRTSPSTAPSRVPDAPTSMSLSAGDGRLLVRWGAPGSDGGAAVDVYEVFVDGRGVAQVRADGRSVYVSASNDVRHTVRLDAHNVRGRGAAVSAVGTPRATQPARAVFYRCRSTSTVDEFVTTSSSCEGSSAYRRTATAFRAPTSRFTGTTALYRLYRSGRHFYTVDPNEKSNLVRAGWHLDATVAWVRTSAAYGWTHVNRLVRGSDHVYCVDGEVSRYSGYSREGSGFWV